MNESKRLTQTTMEAIAEDAGVFFDAPGNVFDVREDANGWTVFNVSTGHPATAGGSLCVGMEQAEAIETVMMLPFNEADARR